MEFGCKLVAPTVRLHTRQGQSGVPPRPGEWIGFDWMCFPRSFRSSCGEPRVRCTAEQLGLQRSYRLPMWYNLSRMARRGVVLALLVIIAAQLTATVAFASVCFEPCPDDTEGATCPPVCSLCTSCTHAQQAIVRSDATAAPTLTAPHPHAPHVLSGPLHLADDIFHVPLLG